MGTFDWVDFQILCPVCAGNIPTFQTKMGNPDFRRIVPAHNQDMHGLCRNCGVLVEYKNGIMTDPTFTPFGGGADRTFPPWYQFVQNAWLERFHRLGNLVEALTTRDEVLRDQDENP